MTLLSLVRALADILRAIVGLDDEDRRAKLLRERAASDMERDARRAKRAADAMRARVHRLDAGSLPCPDPRSAGIHVSVHGQSDGPTCVRCGALLRVRP